MSDVKTIECPLAADGRPIAPGETLYGQDGVPWRITAVGPRFSYGAVKQGADRRLRNEWLTHEPPDSWEQLAADLRASDDPMAACCAYFGVGRLMCGSCRAVGSFSCLLALVNEVADRVERLRKAGGAR